MTRETVELMAAAGCVQIRYGLESGSQILLDKTMSKGTSIQQTKSAFLWAKESGIHTWSYTMVGGFDETAETVKETAMLLSELRPVNIQISMLTPLPRTHFTDRLLPEHPEVKLAPCGFDDLCLFGKCLISTPKLTAEEVGEQYIKLSKEHPWFRVYRLNASEWWQWSKMFWMFRWRTYELNNRRTKSSNGKMYFVCVSLAKYLREWMPEWTPKWIIKSMVFVKNVIINRLLIGKSPVANAHKKISFDNGAASGCDVFSTGSAERRKTARAAIDLTVVETEDVNCGGIMAGNISENGMFVTTDNTWPLGTIKKLRMRFKGKSVTFTATVQRIENGGVVLSYRDISEADKNLIREEIVA